MTFDLEEKEKERKTRKKEREEKGLARSVSPHHRPRAHAGDLKKRDTFFLFKNKRL